MDASPTDRQSTGTVSLLDDGPQRSTTGFCFELQFIFHHPYFNLVMSGVVNFQKKTRIVEYTMAMCACVRACVCACVCVSVLFC